MSYFTIFQEHLFPSYELSDKDKERMNAFLQILEDSNVALAIKETVFFDNSSAGRKPYNPYCLLATIIYAFSQHYGSVRKIEESLKYDLRFMYLMDYRQPSYITISTFLNNVVVTHHKQIFTAIAKTIIDKYNICIEDVFIDGTKIEANANKYKFVWKPTTFHNNLNVNIRTLLLSYFPLPDKKKSFTSREVGTYLNDLLSIIERKEIDVISYKKGRGNKLPKLAKDYFKLSDYLLKSLEYEEKEAICGDDRRSYYKTDNDATAMCLKKDYYSGLGSNMHAGYNLQLIVSKGIILDYYVSQDRTDLYTFIPSLKAFYNEYGFYPKNLCADAGYGSYTNYLFMKENSIMNYVKFQMWQQEISGKMIDLYKFDESNNLICLNNRVAECFKTYNGCHCKSQNANFYVINNCLRCTYKPYCKKNIKSKSNNFRVFEANSELYFFKEEAKANLLSIKGIEMRVNRSSQVEGAIGVIKQDMGYNRIRRRGLDNVTTEIMLVCLGYVVRKLFTLIDGKGKLDYWKAPTNLQPEKIDEVKLEKLIRIKPRTKGLNESLRRKKQKKSR